MGRMTSMDAIAFVVIVILGIANLVAWSVLRFYPHILLSQNERLKLAYLDRFNGELQPFISQWFDIQISDWQAFRSEYGKMETGSHIYDSFVEFRHPILKGRFLNYDEAGFRHGRDQGSWPPSKDTYNIFFFGGSTALNVGPDWTCISSYLQEELNRMGVLQRPIRLYNFGRGSYFSTQERILFEQLLLAGHVPNMAVFFDGVNDCYFYHGKPATWGIFAQALDSHNRENYENIRNKTHARIKWSKFAEFLLSLPLAMVVQRIGDAIADTIASPEEVQYRSSFLDEATTAASISRWLGNKRLIEAVACAHNVRALFIWQPTPAYKYDLKYHVALNAHYGLGGHERSGVGYTYLERHLHELRLGNEFIWLADMQENAEEPLYLDSMHYTAAFSRDIAETIARLMVARKVLL